MKITVALGQAEITYSEEKEVNNYPRIVSEDKYRDITKSERVLQVVSHLVSEVIRMNAAAKPDAPTY